MQESILHCSDQRKYTYIYIYIRWVVILHQIKPWKSEGTGKCGFYSIAINDCMCFCKLRASCKLQIENCQPETLVTRIPSQVCVSDHKFWSKPIISSRMVYQNKQISKQHVHVHIIYCVHITESRQKGQISISKISIPISVKYQFLPVLNHLLRH